MLSKLSQLIKELFRVPSEQEVLDDFIASNHPKSVGEVEHWIKVYDQRKANSRFLQHWR
jgi:hypothetical protein